MDPAQHADERPITESLRPILEHAKAERAELQKQIQAAKQQATASDAAAKSKRAELVWLQGLIKTLPASNARLPEYVKILDEQTKTAERYEAQAHAHLAQGAEGPEAKLRAVESEIAQLEQHFAQKGKQQKPGPVPQTASAPAAE